MDQSEKSFVSLFLYEDTAKVDLEKFKKEYPIKYKKDILSIILLIIGLAFIACCWLLYFFIPIGLIIICIMLYFHKKYNSKKQVYMLDQYERYINSNIKDKNIVALSALYPVYLKYDNLKKILSIEYQDKIYLNCEYSDFISYDILIDKVKYKSTRLPDSPDPTIRSYVLDIALKDGHRVEIGFSNAAKSFLLGGKFVFAQYANTKSINKLATIIDKIKKTGKV